MPRCAFGWGWILPSNLATNYNEERTLVQYFDAPLQADDVNQRASDRDSSSDDVSNEGSVDVPSDVGLNRVPIMLGDEHFKQFTIIIVRNYGSYIKIVTTDDKLNILKLTLQKISKLGGACKRYASQKIYDRN